ncbi:MAG: phenylacetate-CoA oxygenase subunit PaaC [Flavobacteriales bacterium]|nr:phenylacetate-CoA oxygenase subunit PaaC [Flavobacteriales bacterium]
MDNLYNYILTIADNCLILGQRLGELCGHGPSLETDIAVTNISLDLIGQTRSYYQYAAEIEGKGRTEDDIAFLRLEKEYKNCLLVEQPNEHFGYVIGRQYLWDTYHYLFLSELQGSADEILAAIAKKAIKEVSYHKRFSGDWVKRLGDGTNESRGKMQEAICDLWPYVDELFDMTGVGTDLIENRVAVDLSALKEAYYEQVFELLSEATLDVPERKYFIYGGKKGVHSEHLGYLLTDLQYMQRAYPNMEW